MHKKICEQCGREYTVYQYRKDSSRFCSNECHGKWKAKNLIGKNSPTWRGHTVKVCERCGKEYEVIPSQNSSRFCSRKCYGKWRSENIRGDNHPRYKGKIKKICEQCGLEFGVYPSWSGRRFCSEKCMGEWYSENAQRGENHPDYKPKIKMICELCGKEYEIDPYRINSSRFCSRECMGRWYSGENASNWNGGSSFEPYCPKFDEKFKESIREKFGRVCFLCPTTEEENGKKLSVHHINYNKDCLCDDSDCRFVPLCMRCHGKTNHDREHWENLIMEKLNGTSSVL